MPTAAETPRRVDPRNIRLISSLLLLVVFGFIRIILEDPRSIIRTSHYDHQPELKSKSVEPTSASPSMKPQPDAVASYKEKNEIDWSDPMLARGGHGKPIVIESHKLVFFFIPKVACSVFKMLFRRMMGFSDWLDKNPHAPSNLDDFQHLGDFSRHKQLTMMTSPNWTRAIFVRDPLERTLSAYKDKGFHRGGEFVYNRCCRVDGKNETMPAFCSNFPFNKTNFPFETFVNHVLFECKTSYDGHWKPQSLLLHKDNWNFINFVGNLKNGEADTHLLLKQIGAFEEFGASGWGEFRNQSFFQSNRAKHKTDSMSAMEQHYTPDLRKRVFEYVRGDYEMELFNFTIPSDLL